MIPDLPNWLTVPLAALGIIIGWAIIILILRTFDAIPSAHESIDPAVDLKPTPQESEQPLSQVENKR